MNELWVPDIPADPLPFLGQVFDPSSFLGHRTIGHWAGDYAVLSRGRVPSVHGLIGEYDGQAVQWYPSNRTVAGAAGANGYAWQWEFSGENGAPLTAWQESRLAILCGFAARNGIDMGHRLGQNDGRVTWWAGYLNHTNVTTEPRYTHYDYVNDPDVALAIGVSPPPIPVLNFEEHDLMWWIYNNKRYATNGTFIIPITAAQAADLDRPKGTPSTTLNKAQHDSIVRQTNADDKALAAILAELKD